MSGDPIHGCVDGWHEFVRTRDLAKLDALVHDDCTFYSPVLYRPQVGKQLTLMYLTAALGSLGGSPADAQTGEWDGGFRYVREVAAGHDAVLEFETTLGGAYVNGVDLIRCDDTALIIDFKVMVRPQRGLDAVREAMLAALTATS